MLRAPTTRRSYANRVRQVMDTYRQDGAAKVYWLTVMTPRDPDAQRVIKMVNAAIDVAAAAVAQPGPGRRHGPDLHPGRPLHATRSTSTASRRSSASPTASTSTRGARRSPPTLVLDRIDEDFTPLSG